MRNHEEANSIDVELYFRDFNKLVLKMQRLDAATLDLALIKKHRIGLKAYLGETNDKKYEEFLPLIEWGAEFCNYAEKVKNVQGKQDNILGLT